MMSFHNLHQRPPENERCFRSAAVDAFIERTCSALSGTPELARLFANCFPNTLDTTVRFEDGERPDTFVITGDIPAMWLRDSAAQVWHYLPFCNEEAQLSRMIQGVIHRQTDCILLDPYANAFTRDPTDTSSPHAGDHTEMTPGVWERKWEIDSLCYPIRLAYGFWTHTGDTSPFDDRWLEAMKTVVRTFREQQRFHDAGPYRFRRTAAIPNDTCTGNGYGAPANPCGLIVSAFRPSDDACTFPYLVPSNLFAIHSLRQLAELLDSLSHSEFAKDCRAFAEEVEAALEQNALGIDPLGHTSWCYECDGFGNRLFMDDPNVPSLLSLPYLGICDAADPVYQSTRAWVLSEHNPYFRQGTAATGLSGPHIGRDWIWPMAILLQAITSADSREQEACTDTLLRTHADTFFMHETFHCDDPAQFTRSWFAWANSLCGEWIAQWVKAE